MPTYQYRCQTCGEEYEAHQSFHDDPLTYCAGVCDGTVSRVFAVANVILKGDGFYSTEHGTTAGLAGAEKQQTKDMDAYKRLRGEGHQPPMIQGSSDLERKATTGFEVDSGQAIKNDKTRKAVGDYLENAK
jgi:putative FmdB family regulatory protein